ncbi:hypothetical protein FG476_07045 [Xylella fastidiosa subsp. multiplex]|uniref:Uncharacterized protein n=2 Tax=Xylella fastidiosa TaxID=2371 RepID=A0A060H1R4_XYLFS|nr:conserved hypothetical protein [Xylella fastidiosa M12]AIC09255.1 hypothetical protein D934_01300 [Xylella fastidiosa subsp. sandyi Ann-1]AIC13306.1 hypothetical protein P303_11590 [Xylella fastidiosa MUL0034]ERI60537.1 hypothetical protein M233_03685 [Xylella fastidiosa subsp. multiplex Griffin-1]KQH73931.1 hypothetical protein AOT81_05465 [Xylella fastidiosa]MBE0268035.1 hypothetical protein [Xylella fastidiosa subsp. multiplex]RWA44734.1 hypothetical protein XfCFBP8356_04400 [Xylella fa
MAITVFNILVVCYATGEWIMAQQATGLESNTTVIAGAICGVTVYCVSKTQPAQDDSRAGGYDGAVITV